MAKVRNGMKCWWTQLRLWEIILGGVGAAAAAAGGGDDDDGSILLVVAGDATPPGHKSLRVHRVNVKLSCIPAQPTSDLIETRTYLQPLHAYSLFFLSLFLTHSAPPHLRELLVRCPFRSFVCTWVNLERGSFFSLLPATIRRNNGLQGKSTLPWCSKCAQKLTRSQLIREHRITSSFGDRSFAAAGPRAWNKLPPPLRHVHSATSFSFKRQLKTFLFNNAFNLHC